MKFIIESARKPWERESASLRKRYRDTRNPRNEKKSTEKREGKEKEN